MDRSVCVCVLILCEGLIFWASPEMVTTKNWFPAIVSGFKPCWFQTLEVPAYFPLLFWLDQRTQDPEQAKPARE